MLNNNALSQTRQVNPPHEHTGYLWAGLGILCFCLTLPVTKIMLPDFSPMFIALGRSAIAGIIAVLLLWRAKAPLPSLKQVVWLISSSIGIVFGFPILSALAMQSTSATHGGIIAALLPLSTAIAATLITREKQSQRFWLYAFLASSLVLVFSLTAATGAINQGDLWLVLSLPLGALGYATGGYLSKQMPAWQVICWTLILCLPITLPYTVVYWPTTVSDVATNSWFGLIYVALFSQLLGFFFWNKGLALGGIAKVSQLQLLQPFGTLIAASWLLGEVFEAHNLMACAAVVVLVYLGKRA
ncbi:DMT family transporter [Algibacillus agarilyticus]|uniref:DMT family transporter n=1 Tax=Algibacillus agarilyticus TaxID=2234133 RepID=UPI000DD0AEBB|nr:DMT family transporter [Algibacillus agarilyticus]